MTVALEVIFKIFVLANLCVQLNRSYVLDPNISNNNLLRIYHGTPAKLGEVPFQVAFKAPRRDRRYQTFCGGSIVGPSKILTAAHCFAYEATNYLTCTETYTIRSYRDKYAVAATLRNIASRAEKHEQWRKLYNVTITPYYDFPYHDLAIVFVTKPFIYNDYVKPISYAMKNIDYNGRCLISGYGRITNTITSDSLIKGYVYALSVKLCNAVHSRDTSYTICTSIDESDIGQGDSGGPLICAQTGDPMERSDTDGVLVGVASGTYEGFHSVFTRLSRYKDFIEHNRGVQCSRVQLFYAYSILLPQYIFLILFNLLVFYY